MKEKKRFDDEDREKVLEGEDRDEASKMKLEEGGERGSLRCTRTRRFIIKINVRDPRRVKCGFKCWINRFFVWTEQMSV